jgi:putative nucleotidyltransferase with HDIG domain
MKSSEAIITKFKAVKTLPHVAMKLIKMLSADEGMVRDYEEVIRHDPSLVMRVFKLVNSAYFALPEKVEILSDALSIMGLNNLRNMVVIEALKEIYKGKMKAGRFSGKALWNHCLATGLCCRMISERIFDQKGEDAFLSGLLHDVGLMVEFQAAPDLFESMSDSKQDGVSIIDHENKVFGTNHSETGFWLAREWKLPPVVQFAIRDHHKVIDDLEPSSITGMIQLAELIASRSGYMSHPEKEEALSPPLVRHLRETIDEYLIIQQDLNEEMDKAKGVYSA